MKLRSYYVTAAIYFLLGFSLSAQAARNATPMVLSSSEMHALALEELRTIHEYIVRPADLTIERLSRQLRFEHAVEQCMEGHHHQRYCLYSLTTQHSDVARILTLGIGQSKTSKLPGARIDWTPWSDRLCVTPSDLQQLLGDGEVIDVNIPYVAPGSTATPPAYRTILYAAIPHGVRGAQAKATFRERCVTEIDFIF